MKKQLNHRWRKAGDMTSGNKIARCDRCRNTELYLTRLPRSGDVDQEPCPGAEAPQCDDCRLRTYDLHVTGTTPVRQVCRQHCLRHYDEQGMPR